MVDRVAGNRATNVAPEMKSCANWVLLSGNSCPVIVALYQRLHILSEDLRMNATVDQRAG